MKETPVATKGSAHVNGEVRLGMKSEDGQGNAGQDEGATNTPLRQLDLPSELLDVIFHNADCASATLRALLFISKQTMGIAQFYTGKFKALEANDHVKYIYPLVDFLLKKSGTGITLRQKLAILTNITVLCGSSLEVKDDGQLQRRVLSIMAGVLEPQLIDQLKDQLKSLLNVGTIKVWPQDGHWGAGVVKIMVIATSVTSIDRGAFRNGTSLTTIQLPESITRIDCTAFSGCTSLRSIQLPSSLTSIGRAAFDGCTSLTSINLPESIKRIESGAFFGCTSLTSINLPESITRIERGTFFGCTSLRSIQLPSSLTSIGRAAFDGCTSLTSINLPESIKRIESGAFFGCTSLTSINLPESITRIERGTFFKCTSLRSIQLPSSLTCIGGAAFNGCTSLTSINLPESIKRIESDAFFGCTSLTSIKIKTVDPRTYETIKAMLIESGVKECLIQQVPSKKTTALGCS